MSHTILPVHFIYSNSHQNSSRHDLNILTQCGARRQVIRFRVPADLKIWRLKANFDPIIYQYLLLAPLLNISVFAIKIIASCVHATFFCEHDSTLSQNFTLQRCIKLRESYKKCIISCVILSSVYWTKMILEAPSPHTTSSSKVILQYVRMAS